MGSFPFAEDFHAHIFGVAQRARFGEPDTDFFKTEFFQEHLGQAFGEGLDQEKAAFGDEVQAGFGEAFVVDRVLDPVALAGLADVSGKFHIDHDFLQDFAFPVKNPDLAARLKPLNKDLVLHGHEV